MDKLTIVVSIGRNIGDAPMPETAWQDFCLRMLNTVKETPNATILAETLGTGEYNNGTFITQEETAVLIAQIPKMYSNALQVMLSGLAYIYAQEGYGYVAVDANTSFVKADAFGTERV